MRSSFVLTALSLVAASCASQGSGNDLQDAIDGHPSATTISELAKLLPVLTAEDWAYLSFARWPDDHGTAALTDPVLQKAVRVLLDQPGAALVPADVGYDPGRWSQLYDEDLHLMTSASTQGYAGSPAAATAFLELLLGAFEGDAASPLPDPTVAADGLLDGCGKQFYDTQSSELGPDCSISDFCCNGDVDFKTGTVTCNDFTSCRGTGSVPMFGVGEPPASGDCDGTYDVTTGSLYSSQPTCVGDPADDVPPWTAVVVVTGSQAVVTPSAPFSGSHPAPVLVQGGICYLSEFDLDTGGPCPAVKVSFTNLLLVDEATDEFNEDSTRQDGTCGNACIGIPAYSVKRR